MYLYNRWSIGEDEAISLLVIDSRSVYSVLQLLHNVSGIILSFVVVCSGSLVMNYVFAKKKTSHITKIKQKLEMLHFE